MVNQPVCREGPDARKNLQVLDRHAISELTKLLQQLICVEVK